MSDGRHTDMNQEADATPRESGISTLRAGAVRKAYNALSFLTTWIVLIQPRCSAARTHTSGPIFTTVAHKNVPRALLRSSYLLARTVLRCIPTVGTPGYTARIPRIAVRLSCLTPLPPPPPPLNLRATACCDAFSRPVFAHKGAPLAAKEGGANTGPAASVAQEHGTATGVSVSASALAPAPCIKHSHHRRFKDKV